MGAKGDDLGLSEQLIESLRLMAATAETQASVLPDFVAKPDEVALGFLDAYYVLDLESIRPLVRAQLAGLAAMVEELPLESEAFWDPATLDSPPFNDLRRDARSALEAFGFDVGRPRPTGTFVQNRGNRSERKL